MRFCQHIHVPFVYNVKLLAQKVSLCLTNMHRHLYDLEIHIVILFNSITICGCLSNKRAYNLCISSIKMYIHINTQDNHFYDHAYAPLSRASILLHLKNVGRHVCLEMHSNVAIWNRLTTLPLIFLHQKPCVEYKLYKPISF